MPELLIVRHVTHRSSTNNLYWGNPFYLWTILTKCRTFSFNLSWNFSFWTFHTLVLVLDFETICTQSTPLYTWLFSRYQKMHAALTAVPVLWYYLLWIKQCSCLIWNVVIPNCHLSVSTMASSHYFPPWASVTPLFWLSSCLWGSPSFLWILFAYINPFNISVPSSPSLTLCLLAKGTLDDLILFLGLIVIHILNISSSSWKLSEQRIYIFNCPIDISVWKFYLHFQLNTSTAHVFTSSYPQVSFTLYSLYVISPFIPSLKAET